MILSDQTIRLPDDLTPIACPSNCRPDAAYANWYLHEWI